MAEDQALGSQSQLLEIQNIQNNQNQLLYEFTILTDQAKQLLEQRNQLLQQEQQSHELLNQMHHSYEQLQTIQRRLQSEEVDEEDPFLNNKFQ